MSAPRDISHEAMRRAFEALDASCEAALMTAFAATGERFEPPPPVAPARDVLHATRRVVYLACKLKDALLEYCIATELPDLDPYDDDPEPGGDQDIPF